MEVGLLAAVVAGVLSLLSPCSALLLPSFFAYAFASPTAQLLRTTAFYLGLLLTLVPLGVGAAAASRLFYGHRELLITTAGWLVIAMGVLMILGRGLSVPFAGRLRTLAAPRTDPRAGLLSTVLLGAVYGLAGFCSGPVLGAILTIAATQDTPFAGGVLLAAYALGMALPLFFLALVWDRFDLGHRRWLRGRMITVGPIHVHSTTLVSGLLIVAIGVLFLRFDGTAGITGVLGMGDTTELEFTLQERITTALAAVPSWVLSGLGAVVAGLWLLHRMRRDREVVREEPEMSKSG
ncbi:MAG: cytochrome c biogenesis CcdA family protein [Dermatophilaceae bacterium]|nr:cytochrome c biogenesis CcdA family protein [Intrasporangiaceae bacterium]